MPEYRKKPVVIEAMQLPFDDRPGDYTTDDYHARGSELAREVQKVAIWMVEHGYNANPDGEDVDEWEDQFTVEVEGERLALPEYGINYLEILTLEGEMNASPGDWVIRGVQGEFYPCKPDIFEQTYEPVSVPVQRTADRETIARAIVARIAEHFDGNSAGAGEVWSREDYGDHLTDVVLAVLVPAGLIRARAAEYRKVVEQ